MSEAVHPQSAETAPSRVHFGLEGRVVVITALCDPAQRQAALAAGANDYVLKTALLEGVEGLLRH